MKRISLAVIGCGGFVKYHLRELVKSVPQFQCVALCDIVPEHARNHAGKFFPGRDIPIFTDYRKMLEATNPSAVIVSTPHTLHYQMCYDAISAGAHVMVDKPMVTDSAHARKLVRHANARGKALLVAIQGTYTDTFAYARKLLSDGTVGKLQLVTGVMAQGWMHLTAGKWRQKPALSGGGQLYDSTCHVLSAMMYLVNSPVKEVCCWTDYKGREVDINAVGMIRFANGCMATITSGGNCPTWKSHLIFQGDNAIMEISPHGGDFRVHGESFKQEIVGVPRGWKIKTVFPIQNFAQVIQKKAAIRCGGEVGILMADLMDGLYASARGGKPVRLRSRAAT